jgi:hypothetical protein
MPISEQNKLLIAIWETMEKLDFLLTAATAKKLTTPELVGIHKKLVEVLVVVAASSERTPE